MTDPVLRPLRLGDLTIERPVGLAPMAGFTDAVMRSLCREFGGGFTFTEVVNAQGLLHASRPTLYLLETVPGERPVAAHMYGSDPAAMAEAALFVEKLGRFDFIDLNAGCPVRKIVAKGAGVALMRDPQRMADIVAAMCSAVSLPVTVKTRLGLTEDSVNISEVAHAIEEAGAAAIFIHARVAANKHAGPPDWAMLARIKSERSIPIVGNGGVKTADDVFEMVRQTGVDGVIIGRAAIGNPWIFEEVACRAEGHPFVPATNLAKIGVIEKHFDRLVELKAKDLKYRRQRSLALEQSTALHFRAQLVKYLAGGKSWATVRRRLNDFKNREDVFNAVRFVLHED